MVVSRTNKIKRNVEAYDGCLGWRWTGANIIGLSSSVLQLGDFHSEYGMKLVLMEQMFLFLEK
jgi:hypothetical protein